jgi:hypothetical protein
MEGRGGKAPRYLGLSNASCPKSNRASSKRRQKVKLIFQELRSGQNALFGRFLNEPDLENVRNKSNNPPGRSPYFAIPFFI